MSASQTPNPTHNDPPRAPASNPLEGMEDEDIEERAGAFWTEHNLKDYVPESVFAKGAIGFKDLDATLTRIRNGQETEGLTEDERLSFKRAKPPTSWEHIKGLSKPHKLVMMTCIFAAITQGWDQSSMNGANLRWPIDFKIKGRRGSDWIFSAILAAPFFSASIGCIISDAVNDKLAGRRGALTVAGIFSLASVIGAACTRTWQELLVCRVLLGIGMGAKASVVSIYISEISPDEIRGMLLTCWQLFDTFGIFLGFAVNRLVYKLNSSDSNWRIMVLAPAFPAFIFLSLVYFCVESPRWYIKQNRIGDALKAFIHLHNLPSPIVACGDLYLSCLRLKEEIPWLLRSIDYRNSRSNVSSSESVLVASGATNHDSNGVSVDPRSSDGDRTKRKSVIVPESFGARILFALDLVFSSRWRMQSQRSDFFTPTTFRQRLQLLRKRGRVRRAMYASAAVMIAQQACGFNILAFLSSTIYADSLGIPVGDSIPAQMEREVLSMSLLIGAFNFICTWAVFPLIESKGRRFLLNISFPAMATLLTICAMVLLAFPHDQSGQIQYPVQYGPKAAFQALSILFTVAYSIGEGPAAFVVSAEVYPLLTRELGMSFAVLLNFFCAGILSIFTMPMVKSKMHLEGVFGLFAGLNLLSWIACFVLVPDTHKKSLDSIHEIFQKGTNVVFEYRMYEISYYLKLLLRQNPGRKIPLDEYPEQTDEQQLEEQQSTAGIGSTNGIPLRHLQE